MRKLFEEFDPRRLKHFYGQRDDLLLLVACGDSDVALVLKALRDLDRESPDGLFLLFGDDFRSAWSVRDEAGQKPAGGIETDQLRLADRRTGTAAACGVARSDEIAAVRLEAGLAYAQSLITPKEGQKYVWAMGPDTISDPQAYFELLTLLAPRPDIRPWMRGARLVARVPVDFQLDRSPFVRAKRVHVEPFVIPPDTHEQGLLADAADPKLPIADRMQAEVQLAYLDYAHSRFEPATAEVPQGPGVLPVGRRARHGRA